MFTQWKIFIEHSIIVEYTGKNRNPFSLCVHQNDSKFLITKININYNSDRGTWSMIY